MIKKPIAWIVDSTAYISEELRQHPDFFSVPLNIHFGEKQFVDGVDLNPQQLYEKIKNAKEFPKSSQPSAGAFAERYKVIAEQYEQAIAVHVSGKMSGTLASSIDGPDALASSSLRRGRRCRSSYNPCQESSQSSSRIGRCRNPLPSAARRPVSQNEQCSALFRPLKFLFKHT